MSDSTNGCSHIVHCDDTHNDKRCTITFICNAHTAGYHVATYGDKAHTHSATR